MRPVYLTPVLGFDLRSFLALLTSSTTIQSPPPMASLARPIRRLPARATRRRAMHAPAPVTDENAAPTNPVIQPATNTAAANATAATTMTTATGNSSVTAGLRIRDENACAEEDTSLVAGTVRILGPQTPPPSADPPAPTITYPTFRAVTQRSPGITDPIGSFVNPAISQAIDEALSKMQRSTALLSSPPGTLDPRRLRLDSPPTLELPEEITNSRAWQLGWSPSPGGGSSTDMFPGFPPMNHDTAEESLRPRKRSVEFGDCFLGGSLGIKKAKVLETVEEGEDDEEAASCSQEGEDDIEETDEDVDKGNMLDDAVDDGAEEEVEDSTEEHGVDSDADDESTADA
ncbi:hypothetical protein FA13DRAFT_1745465 [Coprinellus micaceus]|uniref:Uncharacterized protein n=1 Tax=Coprinellus micaceus TaxID=71717 RepID=A0A4Y7SBA7_COPMI|nr:hypothetical protein FA13DRAFT_1745465 [Coprinellus micaceus]